MTSRVTIELPWPAKELSPNARVHHMRRAEAIKRARETAAWAALAAGAKRIETNALQVTITFAPPDRIRRDLDNLLSSLKGSLDGIADVTGVDDSNWSIRIERTNPVKGGAVRVELEAE